MDLISLEIFYHKYISHEIEYLFIPSYPDLSNILYTLRDLKVETKDVYIIDANSFVKLIRKYKSFDELLRKREEKIPFLNSLEYEVSHHCNLNCFCCNHFSQLKKEPEFGNINSFIRDLKQLSSFIECIGTLKLLGGEPLLNPQLQEFIKCAREILPDTEIQIVTNGILVDKMSHELIQVVKENNIIINLSIYPKLKEKSEKIITFIEKYNMKYIIGNNTGKFCVQINSEGNSDARLAERSCLFANCHIFEKGKITKCTLNHKIYVYNTYFNTSIPQCSVDIYDLELTANKLFDYLTNPIDMCKFCGIPRWFSWQSANNTVRKDDYECKMKYI